MSINVYPPPSVVDRSRRHVTRRAFLVRFTQAERLAIRAAAKTTAAIEDYLAMVDVASYIDLDSAQTQGGLAALEAAGLLAAGRAAAIHGGAITDDERP